MTMKEEKNNEKKIEKKKKHAVRKVRLSLVFSLILNQGFAIFYLFIGILIKSAFNITTGIYYMILTLSRFLLLINMKRNEPIIKEWKAYQGVGILLFVLSVIFTGLASLMIILNISKSYPGYLIYAVAFYTFYCIIHAIFRIIKYQKYGNPILSAAKTLSLVTALVSLFSLTDALITTFGTSGTFRLTMMAIVGGTTAFLLLALSIYMLFKSGHQIRMLNNTSNQKALK